MTVLEGMEQLDTGLAPRMTVFSILILRNNVSRSQRCAVTFFGASSSLLYLSPLADVSILLGYICSW